MTKVATVLTERDVVAILGMLAEKQTHRQIAKHFKVSTKTVSRINTGETWKDVSLRYNMHVPVHSVPMPQITGASPELCDLLDEIVAVKNHFGFEFSKPLYWGWFRGWDGVHALVSDGYIIWESSDLVTYAKKLAATEIDTHPVFAQQAEELPSFELEDIMSQPVGATYEVDATAGNIVRLKHGEQTVFLRAKYVNIARKMKLAIRVVEGRDDYVYLTRNKPKSPSDPMPIVIACVTTLKEATNGQRHREDPETDDND